MFTVILLALFLHALPVLAVACLGRLELLGTSLEGGSGWAHVTLVPVQGEPGLAPGAPQVATGVPPPLPPEAFIEEACEAEPPALPDFPRMTLLDSAFPFSQDEGQPLRPEGSSLARAPWRQARPGAGSGGPVRGEGESLGSSGELDGPIWNPRPAYPSSARKAGWEGCVEIVLEVGADGRVIQARVLSSSGHEILDQAALDALGRWRFAPRRCGISMKTIHQEVVFRLENSGVTSLVQE